MDIKKSITIKEVAEKAGVSIATVSRVLNNPSKVKPDTIEKVNAAIDELQYKSSSLDSRIKKKRPGFVVIFIPTLNSESLSEIARGVQEELEKSKVDSLIWNSNENIYTEMRGLKSILNYNIKGAIFITSCAEDVSLKMVAQKVPAVVVERTILDTPNIDLIMVDSDQGMEILIKNLYDKGHRKFGLLCGDISGTMASIKTQSYKKALLKLGLKWDASTVISSGWSIEGGYTGTKQLMGLNKNITAIICITDVLAVGATSAIFEMGYDCPGDISVAGFDNLPSGKFLYPKITTMKYGGYKMGQVAAQTILNKIANPKTETKKLVFPMELIERNSTGQVKK